MRKLTNFQALWSPYNQTTSQQSVFLDASNGPAVVTVLTSPDGDNGIYLENILYQVCVIDCPNITDSSPSVKLVAGGVTADYNSTFLSEYRDSKLFDDRNYPQFIPGIARSFVLEAGQATVYFSSSATGSNDNLALGGRNGFVMSNNYPFSNENQNSKDFVLNSVDGYPFIFFYTIRDESTNDDAYLNFTLNDLNKTTNFVVNLHNLTNLPASFNLTTMSMTMTIIGGNRSSNGIYVPYKIHSDAFGTTTSQRTTIGDLDPMTRGTAPTTTTVGTTGSTTPSPPNKDTLKIILIGVGILLFLILILLLVLCLRYRIRRGKYRKFWATMSGVLPIAVKVDEWELGDKQLEIFEDKELGRGAFGIVYEGELYGDRPVDRIIRSVQKMTQEEKEQKKVAVKRLPLNADNQARLDFTEEISFMKKLGYHPHILGMIGCITAGASMPVIVLDYCKHGDLLSWIRKQKYSIDLKPEQLLSIAWQISDGCYLKSLNLIHRDLAARNILLTEDLVAKISDFGLCRKPENSEDSATYLPHFYVSRGGRLPVKWLAPESLRDFQFSFKTDLWSYGVILWEMYTFGDVPFGDANTLNLYELLESGERLPKGAIPDPMYDLMSGCWNIVPGKRTPIEKIQDILREMLTSTTNNYDYLMISAEDGVLNEEETEFDHVSMSNTACT